MDGGGEEKWDHEDCGDGGVNFVCRDQAYAGVFWRVGR